MRLQRRQAANQRLTDYLAAQPGGRVTLRFTEVEGVLGRPLPSAAWSVGWWKNTHPTKTYSRAWRAAGWRVAQVDIWAQTVIFERDEGDGTEHPAGP